MTSHPCYMSLQSSHQGQDTSLSSAEPPHSALLPASARPMGMQGLSWGSQRANHRMHQPPPQLCTDPPVCFLLLSRVQKTTPSNSLGDTLAYLHGAASVQLGQKTAHSVLGRGWAVVNSAATCVMDPSGTPLGRAGEGRVQVKQRTQGGAGSSSD